MKYFGIKQDKYGEPRSFDGGPKYDDLDIVLFTNVQMLLVALQAITQLFEVNGRERLEQIHQDLTELAPLLGANKSAGEEHLLN